MSDSYTEPQSFRAGETVTWKKKDLADYPQASGYTAKYSITNATGGKLIAGVFASGEWTFTLTAANNDLAAGDYTLYGYVTKGSGASEETVPMFFPAPLTVIASLKAGTAVDTRSFAVKALAQIETFILRVASNPSYEQTIAGRHFSRLNLLEASKFRNQMIAQVEQEELNERIANGQGNGEILTTFESELG